VSKQVNILLFHIVKYFCGKHKKYFQKFFFFCNLALHFLQLFIFFVQISTVFSL